MSCNGYLVETPFGEICIPLIVQEWPPHKPEPDPRQRLFEDIATLATINQGISRLSDHRIRESLSQAVQAAARTVTLPKGVKFGDGLFGDRPAVAMTQKMEVNV